MGSITHTKVISSTFDDPAYEVNSPEWNAVHTFALASTDISDFATAALSAAPAETATTIATIAHGTAAKTTLVDADEITGTNSANSFSLISTTWANARAYLNGFYVAMTGQQTVAGGKAMTVTALSVATNAIAIDLSVSNNFSVTLQATTGQTLSAPTNPVAGQSGQINIKQNGTPSTLAYNTFWKFPGGTIPSVSTTASAEDILVYSCYASSASGNVSGVIAVCQLLKGVA